MNYRIIWGVLLAGILNTAHAQDNVEASAKMCFSCHGANGVSMAANTPSIAGQPEAYLKKALLDWKAGLRHSATMAGMVKPYSEEQLSALAAYFAQKPWSPVAQNIDAGQVALGKSVSERCAGCHGEKGASSDGETPNLNGQWAGYVELELHEYRDDSEQLPNKKMRKVAQKLSEDEIKAVAAYFASQGK